MLDQTPAARAQAMLAKLDQALTAGDAQAAAALFAPTSYWRDLVAFTWNIATMEGREAIATMLRECLADVRPRDWQVGARGAGETEDGTLEAWVDFETEVARGVGHMRVKDGLIVTLLTTMAELKGFEEPTRTRRPLGAVHGAGHGVKSWGEAREEEARTLGTERQPYVVVIGGGQAGIALGARLRQLEVPTIVLEKNERAGDSWRKRYKSLCLHDPVWYDHLPYIPFPANWPVFSPKDKLGDWLEMYVRVMELNYWTSSEVLGATYDDAAGEWTVRVRRDGEELTLRPKHLVFATGMSGFPHTPKFPGAERFAGEQHHSSAHPGPDGYRGRRVVVIGSNNSAHDICAALHEAGVEVTMVQRSSTHVTRSEPLMTYDLGPLYSEEANAKGIDVDTADLIAASVPYAMLAAIKKPMHDRIRQEDAHFYEALERVGFWLDHGDDDTGLAMKYLRRGSGYYIDIGASQLIIDGKIKLVRGQVAEITEDAVVLEDGTNLPADVIVYATGYASMNGFVAKLIDQESADKVGKVWGLGSDTTKDPGPWEGEQRNMWKPTAQDGLWFTGGNLHQSRHYSQFLALQLKARMEGIETPVHARAAVHHTR